MCKSPFAWESFQKVTQALHKSDQNPPKWSQKAPKWSHLDPPGASKGIQWHPIGPTGIPRGSTWAPQGSQGAPKVPHGLHRGTQSDPFSILLTPPGPPLEKVNFKKRICDNCRCFKRSIGEKTSKTLGFSLCQNPYFR